MYAGAPARTVTKQDRCFEKPPLTLQIIRTMPTWFVIYRGNEWIVRKRGNEKATSVHDTKQEAKKKAKQLARRNEGEAVFLGRDGQFTGSKSYK